MSKGKFERSMPHVNIGTIGHVGHSTTALLTSLAMVLTSQNQNAVNTEEPISDRLIALLKHAKSDKDNTWDELAKTLAPIYANKMNVSDVVHHVLEAIYEAVGEPRFELDRTDLIERLMLSPIKGFSSIELFGPSSVKTRYSVEQFYNSIIQEAMSMLYMARVDWCCNQMRTLI